MEDDDNIKEIKFQQVVSDVELFSLLSSKYIHRSKHVHLNFIHSFILLDQCCQ